MRILFLVFLFSAFSVVTANAGVFKQSARPTGNEMTPSEAYYMAQPVARISSAFYVDRAGRIRKLGHLQGYPVMAHLSNYDCRNCVVEVIRNQQGRPISSTVHIDPLQDFVRAYDLIHTPTVAIFDQQGNVRGFKSGTAKWTNAPYSSYTYPLW